MAAPTAVSARGGGGTPHLFTFWGETGSHTAPGPGRKLLPLPSPPTTEEATGFSGDFGSSVGWEDEEEKEPEEAGEEGEEEEGEAGEGDDGGYIW